MNRLLPNRPSQPWKIYGTRLVTLITALDFTTTNSSTDFALHQVLPTGSFFAGKQVKRNCGTDTAFTLMLTYFGRKSLTEPR
jgi:hypothetical protein